MAKAYMRAAAAEKGEGTMKLNVDLTLCQGHGLCYFESDELFDLRESDGKAVVLVDEVPERLHAAARASVQVCPERAIWISE